MVTVPILIDVKMDLLRKQSCFAPLNENELYALAKLLVEKPFSAGETIVIEGESVDSFYLLVSGKAEVIKVSYETNPPQEKMIALLNADHHDSIGLNETGFYSLSGLRTATVIAKTDVVTLFLTVPIFHGFALAHPHVSEVMRRQAAAFINAT